MVRPYVKMGMLGSPTPEAGTEESDIARVPDAAALEASLREVLRLAQALGAFSSIPPVLTVDQAADLLGVDRKAVYTAIERRELPGVRRIGKKTMRISSEALLAWLASGRGR